MATVVLLAAAGGRGGDDFIAGLLIGAAVGLLLGPALRSWLIWRESAEESRQTRLTDEVLARMEEELELGFGFPDGAAGSSHTPDASPTRARRRRPLGPPDQAIPPRP